jgi:pseudouridine-5'-phosphate glycosidase
MMVALSEAVQRALATNQAIVALESTIISHGMPYPANVETALQVEEAVRQEGAIPATIAIIDGVPTAGLSVAQIERIGKTGLKVTKASRRDLPLLMARKKMGATTVASTMIIAAKAGIRIFATGGIGGVHRGATESMDISADLQELAQTDVAVVSAGAKAILDLPLTLEYLETQGVPVIGYQTDEFPAFFTRRSGLSVDYRLNEVEDLARTLDIKWKWGLKGGVLIANPIPEEYEPSFSDIDQAINTALEEAKQQSVTGKELTPFLLSRIEQLTKGKSLKANVQLVLNNARLAARLSKAYSKLQVSP